MKAKPNLRHGNLDGKHLQWLYGRKEGQPSPACAPSVPIPWNRKWLGRAGHSVILKMCLCEHTVMMTSLCMQQWWWKGEAGDRLGEHCDLCANCQEERWKNQANLQGRRKPLYCDIYCYSVLWWQNKRKSWGSGKGMPMLSPRRCDLTSVLVGACQPLCVLLLSLFPGSDDIADDGADVALYWALSATAPSLGRSLSLIQWWHEQDTLLSLLSSTLFVQ